MGFAAAMALGGALLVAAGVVVPLLIKNLQNGLAIERGRAAGDVVLVEPGRTAEFVTVKHKGLGNSVTTKTYVQETGIGMPAIGVAFLGTLVLFLPFWLAVRVTPVRREA